MRDRAMLHIDMNAFYASVAQHLDPSLRGKPVVVAGDPEKRSGIILAKSRQAKAAGVKTTDAIWQAKQKCPDLIIVPPDYTAYKRYSKLARLLYYEYTDQVEPFGLDESWIDVTGSLHLLGGDPMLIAQEISERVKEKLGLTVSVGVSWNKVFAKLGSDTDPGDGTIEITRDNYKEFAWPMPASEMIYVGPATMRKLHAAGYETIGDLAHAGDYFLKNRFGKIGFMLRSFARGEDMSPVRVMDPKRAQTWTTSSRASATGSPRLATWFARPTSRRSSGCSQSPCPSACASPSSGAGRSRWEFAPTTSPATRASVPCACQHASRAT